MNFPSSKNWKTTTLNKVVDLIGGGTPKTTIKKYWNGDIPWLSVVDFNNDARKVYKTEKTITQEGLKNSSTKLLNKGDIIISARGTVGALAQLAKPMAFNQSCYGIRAQNGYDQNFIYYLLKSAVPQLTKNVHGAVFDTLTRDSFASVSVSIPESPVEQKQLADLLGSFDNKIELLQKQNQTLETMAQALFKEWFVDFNFPGTTGEMIDSELGMIPKGWRVGKLGEIANISSGKRPGKISEKETPIFQYPLIGATKTMGYVSEYLLNQDVFIIGRVGTHGKIQRFNGSEKIWPSDNTLVLTTTTPEYLYQILRQIDFQQMNKGAVQSLITQGDMNSYRIIIPGHDIFDKFEETVGSFYFKKSSNNSEIQTLSKIRDELLNKIFND